LSDGAVSVTECAKWNPAFGWAGADFYDDYDFKG